MSKSEATIRDIAKLLGISKSTVSRALNNHYDVSQETSRKVHELAAKIDYHPNLLAQSRASVASHFSGTGQQED